MIKVEQDGDAFVVTVQRASTTTHRVTLSDDDHEGLAGGVCDKPTLIARSFEFLLEREPNTSILSSFDLTVIGRYFPEYASTIRTRI